jgi:hypothetical protein
MKFIKKTIVSMPVNFRIGSWSIQQDAIGNDGNNACFLGHARISPDRIAETVWPTTDSFQNGGHCA